MANSTRKVADFVAPYRITQGGRFRLRDFDPSDAAGLPRDAAEELLRKSVARLSDLQEKLYAQDRWALLLIFQAMDAAGKDGTIKHVMSGVSPQGVHVSSFKAPSPLELDHDFLWRTTIGLPERGRIGIFNRSYYEEVLVVRVHPELLHRQKLPPKCVTKDIWQQRYEDIRAFERYLHRNGVVVRKFFLHVSKEEQKKRFLRRLEEPNKRWKFAIADVAERNHWNDYMKAYEDMVRNTATTHAPWFVVPADNKGTARLIVVSAIIESLLEMNLSFPTIDAKRRKELAAVHRALQRERVRK